jgi:spore coat polysaccharide biosynthesis predicted glycosyltransferase SpsG
VLSIVTTFKQHKPNNNPFKQAQTITMKKPNTKLALNTNKIVSLSKNAAQAIVGGGVAVPDKAGVSKSC